MEVTSFLKGVWGESSRLFIHSVIKLSLAWSDCFEKLALGDHIESLLIHIDVLLQVHVLIKKQLFLISLSQVTTFIRQRRCGTSLFKLSLKVGMGHCHESVWVCKAVYESHLCLVFLDVLLAISALHYINSLIKCTYLLLWTTFNKLLSVSFHFRGSWHVISHNNSSDPNIEVSARRQCISLLTKRCVWSRGLNNLVKCVHNLSLPFCHWVAFRNIQTSSLT